MDPFFPALFRYITSSLGRSIFLLVATVFLGVALYNGWENYSFLQTAQRTKGVVIDYDRPNRGTNYPIVRFSVNGKDSIEFTSNMSTDPPAFDIGEDVEVLYDPHSSPLSAKINSWSQLWLLWVIFGVMSLVFYAVVFGGFLWKRFRSAASMQEEQPYSSLGNKSRTDTREDLERRMAEMKERAQYFSNRFVYIFPAVGVLLLCIAGCIAWYQHQFTANAPQYMATVVGYEPGRRLYYPIFEFVNERGDTIQAFSATGQRPPSHSIGEQALVFYDAENNTATPKGWSEWLGTMIVGGIGIMFLAIGIPLAMAFRKK